MCLLCIWNRFLSKNGLEENKIKVATKVCSESKTRSAYVFFSLIIIISQEISSCLICLCVSIRESINTFVGPDIDRVGEHVLLSCL